MHPVTLTFRFYSFQPGGRWKEEEGQQYPSFSTAEKTKEPSGFCVAKSSPCPVGLRQVTDHGNRFKSGLQVSR